MSQSAMLARLLVVIEVFACYSDTVYLADCFRGQVNQVKIAETVDELRVRRRVVPTTTSIKLAANRASSIGLKMSFLCHIIDHACTLCFLEETCTFMKIIVCSDTVILSRACVSQHCRHTLLRRFLYFPIIFLTRNINAHFAPS